MLGHRYEPIDTELIEFARSLQGDGKRLSSAR